MAKYTTRVEADKKQYPVLLSNGNLIETGDLQGGRHFAVWQVSSSTHGQHNQYMMMQFDSKFYGGCCVVEHALYSHQAADVCCFV